LGVKLLLGLIEFSLLKTLQPAFAPYTTPVSKNFVALPMLSTPVFGLLYLAYGRMGPKSLRKQRMGRFCIERALTGGEMAARNDGYAVCR
jgi:hypothetical protein